MMGGKSGGQKLCGWDMNEAMIAVQQLCTSNQSLDLMYCVAKWVNNGDALTTH